MLRYNLYFFRIYLKIFGVHFFNARLHLGFNSFLAALFSSEALIMAW
jgi:hypothetical protein